MKKPFLSGPSVSPQKENPSHSNIEMESSLNSSPEIPPWSENEPWADDLVIIASECVEDLSSTFEESQDNLESGETEAIPLDMWEQSLNELFDDLKARTNETLDRFKEKARPVFAQIPTNRQREQAVGWFRGKMESVLDFFGFLRAAIGKMIAFITSSVRSAWQAILETLRIQVAERLMTAISRIRGLPAIQNHEMIRLQVQS